MGELTSYLKNLELSNNDVPVEVVGMPTYLDHRKSTALQAVGAEEEESFVNFKSLNSFVAGVSAQRQEDVLNSLLLAQRAAQKAYPGEDQIIEWYETYFKVLTRIGWVFENKGFTNYTVTGKKFEIDAAILDILGAAIASATGVGAAAALALLTKSLTAIKSLADQDSRIVAFEKNVHTLSKGNFQMGIATEENGAVSILSSAFVLETSEHLKRILFFKSSKNDTVFKFNIIKATLSESIFKNARNDIRSRLVGDINDYIAGLPI